MTTELDLLRRVLKRQLREAREALDAAPEGPFSEQSQEAAWQGALQLLRDRGFDVDALLEQAAKNAEGVAPAGPAVPKLSARQPEVIFVVNGEEVIIGVDPVEPLRAARSRALTESHNTGRPEEEWDIREESGLLLDPEAAVGGRWRLFLTIALGFGGEQPKPSAPAAPARELPCPRCGSRQKRFICTVTSHCACDCHRKPLSEQPKPEAPSPWDDGDQPLPEDAAIKAAHPTRTGRHDLYAEAMRLVGAKRSKGALVDLVNWLLTRAAEAPSLEQMLALVAEAQRDGRIPKSPTREEKISWVYGNCKLSNPDVTWEMAVRAVDEAAEREEGDGV